MICKNLVLSEASFGSGVLQGEVYCKGGVDIDENTAKITGKGVNRCPLGTNLWTKLYGIT